MVSKVSPVGEVVYVTGQIVTPCVGAAVLAASGARSCIEIVTLIYAHAHHAYAHAHLDVDAPVPLRSIALAFSAAPLLSIAYQYSKLTTVLA